MLPPVKGPQKLRLIREYSWIGAGVSVIIAAGWTIMSYLNTARIDYSRGFADKQIEVLFETSEAAANLIVATDTEWPAAKAKFWELYWGPLTLFENDSIACSMIALGVLIPEGSQRPDKSTMQSKVNDVTSAVRKYIEERNGVGWRFTVQDVLTVEPSLYNNPKIPETGPCAAKREAPQAHSAWWRRILGLFR